MCYILAFLAFMCISFGANAQTTTCSNRNSTDSSNACANTRFVQTVPVSPARLPAFTGGDCVSFAGSVVLNCSAVKTTASANLQTQRVVMALANNNKDVNIVLLGDSTGDATNEWFYMLGQSLAAQWPAFTVKYRPWGTIDYPPGSEVTIAVGSGTNTLTLWNASIPGSAAYKFAGDNFFAAVININPDLVFMNYGHNGGSSPDAQVAYMTATTSRIAREVRSPIIIIGQNPMQSGGVDTGVTQPKNVAFRALAAREGYGFVDVYSAFIQSGISLSILVPDGTHPSLQGQTIWRDLVLTEFLYSGTVASGLAQPSQGIRTLISISNYADFVRRANLFGGATLSKNTTDYETWGASTKLTTTAASGWIYFDILTGEDAIALRNKTITISARIKVPSGNGVDAGRIEIDDGVGSTITSNGGPQGTEFYWNSVTRAISGSATRIRVYLYGASSAVNSEVNIDRLIVGEGTIPQDAIPVASTPIQRDINIRGAGTSGIGSLYNSSGSSYGLRFIPTETADVAAAWTSEWSGDGFNVKLTGDAYPRVSVTSSRILFGVGAAAPAIGVGYRFSDALAPNAHWYPNSDAAYDLGANGVAWRNIFVTGIYRVNNIQVIGSDRTVTGAKLMATAAVPTQSTCGTSPSIDAGSSPNAGKFTIGSSATACTLTFASAFPTSAYCTVTPAAQPAAVTNIPYISAQSASAFTVSGGTASTSYYYTCGGN